jgi:hypothetical protein
MYLLYRLETLNLLEVTMESCTCIVKMSLTIGIIFGKEDNGGAVIVDLTPLPLLLSEGIHFESLNNP